MEYGKLVATGVHSSIDQAGMLGDSQIPTPQRTDHCTSWCYHQTRIGSTEARHSRAGLYIRTHTCSFLSGMVDLEDVVGVEHHDFQLEFWFVHWTADAALLSSFNFGLVNSWKMPS